MNKKVIITFSMLLISGMTFAQKINIHTVSGTDSYIFSDIDSITFSVTPDTGSDMVSDIDGNVYKTIIIGNQVWMAENLKVTHYRNGDAIPNIIDAETWSSISTDAYCNFNNDVTNAARYGRLYNWYAVNDPRGLAPEGWHVPSDDEWKQIEMYLGMSESVSNLENWRGSNVGGKLKEVGTIHWQSPNSGATNESGFTALPGGHREFSSIFYEGNGEGAAWWSSTGLWYRSVAYWTDMVNRDESAGKQDGFSIRCVRD